MKKFLSVIKNRYIVATLAMGVWLLWFDRNDLFSQLELTRDVRKLEEQKEYLADQNRINQKISQDLKSSSPELIRFARERYLMKEKDEVIYYFEKK